MQSINVIHSFFWYLQGTENWAFRLISNLPGVRNHILSKRFLKNNFYPAEFRFVEFPIKEIEAVYGKKSFGIKAWNKCANFILDRFYVPYAKAMLKSVKADLLHSHFAVVGCEYSQLSKDFNIPHIVSFYGLDYEYLPLRFPKWKKQYQALFSNAQLFLCEGKFGAQKLVDMGCPQEKIRVARLGVEIEKVPYFQREKKTNQLKLLQIANFRKKKGHVYSLKAFIEALKSAPEMHLTIVGKDVDVGIESELRELILKNNVADKVTILGFIDFSHLYDFMKEFHVFIHPSCYTDEKDCEGGAPVVLLDAQATGMPIIATTHCDIPEEVIHERTGFLSPEKDIGSLSQQILRFYHMDDDEYAAFCSRARKHVEANYDIVKNSAQLRKFYNEVIIAK